MPGFTPNEAETLIGQIIHQRIHVDRDPGLELGLFTNTTLDETITEATISEPTGGGYARKILTDANWGVVNSVSSYLQQTFTAGAGGYSLPVYGYFISTISATGTKRILYAEIDPNGPYVMSENDTYKVTPISTTL